LILIGTTATPARRRARDEEELMLAAIFRSDRFWCSRREERPAAARPTRLVLAGLILLAAGGTASAADPACRTLLERWTQIDLYFGRAIAGGGEVSERQFRAFLSGVVTPAFPDGLSVLDVAGQFRAGRKIVRERTKLVVILVPEAAEAAPKVATIVKTYKSRFRQQSVLHTEYPVCLSFD
jgi:hypothetical protein